MTLPSYTLEQHAFYLSHKYWIDTGWSPHRFNVRAGDVLTVDISSLKRDNQNTARAALDTWSASSGIKFVETTRSAQISFSENFDGAYANSDTDQNGFIYRSIVNVEKNWASGSWYKLQTYIHEIGHALGLGHGGQYNGSADFESQALYQEDSWQRSIMSYFDQSQNPYAAADFAFVVTPMMADIFAIQSLYGTPLNTRTSDDVYGDFRTILEPGTDIYFGTAATIYDGGGIDTFNFSQRSANQVIDLREESFSDIDGVHGSLAIAHGTVIENAVTGSGWDRITGNDASNRLEAGDGNDTILGLGGDDILIGGRGADALTGGAGVDRLHGGAGHDVAFFTLARSEYVVTRTESLITVRALSGSEDADYVGSVESLHFADQELHALGLLGDFNGDGRADLALQSQEKLGVWSIEGADIASKSALPDLRQDWTAVGVGDASGDGRSDLLLQNGQTLATWLINGNNVEGGGEIGTLGDGWMVAGMGDVNGNGRSDVLLQNDRAIAVWQLDGSKLVGGGTVGELGEGWQIAGTGDLNGDGRADLLLQNGQTLAVWHLHGSQITSGGVIETLGAGWGVAGIGDFDGKGHSDILLQNGQHLALWQVTGTQVDGGSDVGVMPDGWSVSGLADLNGDHKADILLQNGQALSIWTMNGTQIVSGATVNEQLAPGWDLA